MVAFDFMSYLTDFEQKFILPAAGRAENPVGSMMRVPIARGRLAKSGFGKKMGATILTVEPIVVDYYGYLKFSEGLLSWVEDVRRKSTQVQIRTVEVRVVHFNSVRLETVLAVTPELGRNFSRFKREMLDVRFPGHKYKEE